MVSLPFLEYINRILGWEAHHVLATSWGDGDQGLGEAFGESLKCEHVKQVHLFSCATFKEFSRSGTS